MKVLVTGAGGLIGSALVPALRGRGASVLRAVRRPPVARDEVRWHPLDGRIEGEAVVDAVVHLAGGSLAAHRWNATVKRRMTESRVPATRALCERLAELAPRPAVLIAASAIGYYGDRGDELLDEDSPRGAGFLAELAEAWEQACEPARRAGIRTVQLRFGLVLARSGGALQRLLLPFRLGLGGPLGDGRQYWSWIALDDAVEAILFALEHDRLSGPVNAVAPEALTQREFARALARVLRRPAFLPAPAAALRLVLGEMADAMLLSSSRVRPQRLRSEGFAWRCPGLEGAMRRVIAGRVDDPRSPA